MKKVSKSKRGFVTLVLAFMLMITSLTGCSKAGSESKGDNSATVGETTSTQESTGEKTEEPVKLTIGLSQNSNVENYDTNYLTQLLEKELNVSLEFVFLPSAADDAKSKFAIMTSSNATLPDIVLNPGFSDLEIADYGSKGVFIPLNSYIEDPEMTQWFNQVDQTDRETMIRMTTSPDGNIYALANFSPEDWNLTPFRYWINKVWLDKLGLETPKTTDDFYNVLKAFATEDPNGNGVADEIAITGCKNGWGCNPVYYLMNSFTFYNGNQSSGGLALADDGKTVAAPFTTDGWKAGIEYMTKLCSEGLLSPAVFTQDQTQFQAVLSNEVQITGSCAAGGYGLWPGAQESVNFQEMEMLPPVEGPEGVAYAVYADYTPASAFLITKDCKNPEVAIKLGDLFYRQDVSYTVRYGEEDVDWTTDPEICKNFKGLFEESEGIPCSFTQLNVIWSTVQNKMWYGQGPRYTSLMQYRGIDGQYPEDPNKINYMVLSRQKSAEYYYNAHPETVLPTLLYQKEESEELAQIQESITTYVDQCLAEFITGNRPISDWDNYIKELDTMGLQTWLDTAQIAYDRMMGN